MLRDWYNNNHARILAQVHFKVVGTRKKAPYNPKVEERENDYISSWKDDSY